MISNSEKGPMKLYWDNKSTINNSLTPVQHDKTKNIKVDRHFIKEKLDNGLISMPYVPSYFQLAKDLLKVIQQPDFMNL